MIGTTTFARVFAPVGFLLYRNYFLYFYMKTIGPPKDSQPSNFRLFGVWTNIFRADGFERRAAFGPLKR
jgi:hypothetical protein